MELKYNISKCCNRRLKYNNAKITIRVPAADMNIDSNNDNNANDVNTALATATTFDTIKTFMLWFEKLCRCSHIELILLNRLKYLARKDNVFKIYPVKNQ